MLPSFTKGEQRIPRAREETLAGPQQQPAGVRPMSPGTFQVEFRHEEKKMLSNPTKGNGQMGRHTLTRSVTAPPPRPPIDAANRQAMIALVAYYAAERRGFKGGSAQEDWLVAEIEVDARLGHRPAG